MVRGLDGVLLAPCVFAGPTCAELFKGKMMCSTGPNLDTCSRTHTTGALLATEIHMACHQTCMDEDCRSTGATVPRLHFTRAPAARKSLAQTAECTKRLNMDEEVKSRQVKPPEDQTKSAAKSFAIRLVVGQAHFLVLSLSCPSRLTPLAGLCTRACLSIGFTHTAR